MPLRIVQVGMGGFGRSWASDIIPKVEDAELVACVDINPRSLELARACTSLPDDQYFLSLDDALGAVEADAVLVTTVLSGHIPTAMTALAAGKHVLVEKPFAPSLDDACRAVEAAEERGLILMVSQNYRFFPAVRAIQALMASGELGKLDSVYVDFRWYDNSEPREGHVHYLVPQPMLVDMAIHHFDLMRAIFGREPRQIHCLSWNPPWSKFDDPAEAAAVIQFDGDIVVSYRGSWLSPGTPTPWAGEWRMNFEDALVTWTSRAGGNQEDEADSVTIRRRGAEPELVELPQLAYLDRAGSLNAFIQAVRTGEEPETSGRRNIGTLAFTIATVEAAATAAPVLL
jgi:predicted dehydrogenase